MTRALPSWRRLLTATITAVLLLGFYSCRCNEPGSKLRRSVASVPRESRSVAVSHRKLLEEGRERAREAEETDRIGEGCSKDDIVVYQGATAPLPSGIPTYTVEVLNVCARGCAIEGIHLRCGWFSSARLINPRLFRRLRFDDCLLNDGRPLPNGASLSFQYANSFPYPLSVSSASCLPSS
ncbi:protein TAPETUM DETERMINANT 1-like [Ananas comosus]|uniref:Protein TAPETUM DETERMINANT 1-like n=1 Tax=Ananas comosus TaxID=4615 RepID=A0A6P5GQ70_ANACO|nr:protein TAPETUM DETERMINANT 1-like [Ananas comosus]